MAMMLKQLRYPGPRLERRHLLVLTVGVAVTVFFVIVRDWQFLTRLSVGSERVAIHGGGRGGGGSSGVVIWEKGVSPEEGKEGDKPQGDHPDPHQEQLRDDDGQEIPETNQKQETKERAKTQLQSTHNIIWVRGNGSLVARIHGYVQAITEERAKLVQQSLNVTKWVPLAGPIHSFWGNDVDTIYKLQNHSGVRTVALQWLRADELEHPWTSLQDRENLLLQEYYEWVGTEPLCTWVSTQGQTKARWDAAYNCTCNTDPTISAKPKSLEKIYFHAKPINPSHYWPNGGLAYPEHYYTTLPKHVFYVHIVQSAVIDGVGDVFTSDLKIVPYTCSHNSSPSPPGGFMNTAIYNEVFVITQFWGETFFHMMTESLPRIAPYLEFLKDHPNVLIHAAGQQGMTARIVKLLGLNPWRLISGVCRAKVVYLPQGTYCGFPHVQEMQVLSSIYREIIAETYPHTERNSVLVIRRTGARKFGQFAEIEDIVKTLSQQYNFTYEVFPDNPVPPFEEAMQLFNRAIMVVGPHGAGLSNLLFSQPGTVVIEGVCNPPHVNMCFQRTAHILGHRYHGVGGRGGWTAVQGGCETVVDIHPPVMGEVVETHMKLLKQSTATRR